MMFRVLGVMMFQAIYQRFISRYGCSGMQKVKDSWRVVNHRDIIPTVPRLMGYCHVAQPIYLSAGGRNDNIVCALYINLAKHMYKVSDFFWLQIG